MQVFPVDDAGRLFISAAIDDWAAVHDLGVDVVIDLDGGLDDCIPTRANQCLYVYFPFDDDDQQLPDLIKLRAVARMAAELIEGGHRVLSHCGMGFNRSALVAGLILIELGMRGEDAVLRLRERRAGALYNEMYSTFLESLQSERIGA
jgi:hypothetical protein